MNPPQPAKTRQKDRRVKDWRAGIQGVEGSSDFNLPQKQQIKKCRISKNTFVSITYASLKILIHEVFSLRYSLFLVRYSAVLFGESLTLNHFSIFEMASKHINSVKCTYK